MPLPQQWANKKKRPPKGFDYVEPILEALENELRDVIKDTNLNRRKQESLWPVHQINWQKSRYIYDLFYKHKKLSRQVYQYCLDTKLVDAELIAKWKKPGYERLCSTYVINPANYKFGTVSICRVPWKDRSPDQKSARDPTTGCMGCASGKGQPRNIFGNKYGQSLAAVQVARERRKELKEEQAAAAASAAAKRRAGQQQKEDDDGDAETDDDDGDKETDDEEEEDDDDYGPSPAAGIWAGSQKLQQESEKLDDEDGEAETDDEVEEPLAKKPREEEE